MERITLIFKEGTDMKNLAINKIKRTAVTLLLVATTFFGCFAIVSMNAYAETGDYILGQSAGNYIVDRAMSWVGKAEYVWGACRPGEFDSVGFVSYCETGTYMRMGTEQTFMGWPQTTNPQPGDMCVSRCHCGIYVGDGMMIHAANKERGICIDPVQSGMIYVKCPY